ncbi:hypothetical protein OCU04_004547 [Sclerotinia nivalis]|uniref:Uncharacterized protein n=1 Tax=Sclerotinia nivalis TaxID=352851 RepID=A0A9X0AU20_9HELO|nr:hypothetical protein OCU04_004547 [Sclerotinia nivalis]
MERDTTDPNDRWYTLPGVPNEAIGLLVLGYGDTSVQVDDTFVLEYVGGWWEAVKEKTNGDASLYGGDAAAKASKESIQNTAVKVAKDVGLILVTGGGNLHSADTIATTVDKEEHITVSIFKPSDIKADKIKHIGMVHIYIDATTRKYSGYVVVKKNGTILPKTWPSIFAWQNAQTKKA